MVGLLTAAVLVTALQAPGQIYRCPTADGSTRYQDQPCTGGKQFSGEDQDLQSLRSWLEDLAPPKPAPPKPGGAPHRAAPSYQYRSVSEQLIAVCSERFLACASDKPAAMDRCVAALPRCGDGRTSGCCPSSCVEAYQQRRQAGSPLASAVRGALLDPSSGPSCGAP